MKPEKGIAWLMSWCMKSGCPWNCESPRSGSCADRFLNRGLGVALLLVLVGSVVTGVLSLF